MSISFMKFPIMCWLLVLVFGLSAAALPAQTPSPDNLIPRALLFKEKTRSNVRLSLDGSTVFYQKNADGSDSTLKRFYKEGDKIRLQPSNAAMKPIIVPAIDVQLQGRVIGVLRKYA